MEEQTKDDLELGKTDDQSSSSAEGKKEGEDNPNQRQEEGEHRKSSG